MAFSRENHAFQAIIFPPIGILPPVSIATAIVRNLSICCLTIAGTNWPPLAFCPRSLPLVLCKCCGMVFRKHNSNHAISMSSLPSGCRRCIPNWGDSWASVSSLSLPFSLPTSHVQIRPNDHNSSHVGHCFKPLYVHTYYSSFSKTPPSHFSSTGSYHFTQNSTPIFSFHEGFSEHIHCGQQSRFGGAEGRGKRGFPLDLLYFSHTLL